MTEDNKKNSTDEEEKKNALADENNKYHDLQIKFDELNEKYVRLYADFENSKRMAAKDKLLIMEAIKRKDIIDFLPIIDAVENSIAAALPNKQNSNMASFIKGAELILKNVNSILSNKGVTTIKTKGIQFNPSVHEVVMVDKNSKLPKGTITDQLQKGYMLNEFCLRPAKVVVSGNAKDDKSVKIETEEEDE